MSSDIFSRKIDVSKFGIIYAGAQKNIGPSGVTLVIIRKDLIEKCDDSLTTMLKYKTHCEKGSMFNTPPTFGIYLIDLVMKWLDKKGGVEGMQKINEEKANALYEMIDNSPMYRGTAAVEDRSNMNVTFRLTSEELEQKFIKESTEAGLIGLKGHRSVGGCRASIYNAMSLEGVQKLIEFMKNFEQQNS
jgi:phosphoserine aminotransferase